MMTLALAVLGLIPDMGIWLVVMAFAVYAFFSLAGRVICSGSILMNSSRQISAPLPWA